MNPKQAETPSNHTAKSLDSHGTASHKLESPRLDSPSKSKSLESTSPRARAKAGYNSILALFFALLCGTCWSEEARYTISQEDLGIYERLELEGDNIDIAEILRAQEQALEGRSIEEKIAHYKQLLQSKGITPQATLYTSHHYIESRFATSSPSKKARLSAYYASADKKSGAFLGVMLGEGALRQTYIDGLYNRANNVPKDEAGSICVEGDSSGCKRSGVFRDGELGLDFSSDLRAFGGGFGYQKFFNPFLGSRIYGDGLLSSGGENLNRVGDRLLNEVVGSFTYALGSMNADLLIELPFHLFTQQRILRGMAVGAYGGISIGVLLFFDESSKNLSSYTNSLTSQNVLWNYLLQVEYGFNLGFSFAPAPRYRFDLGAKIPMSELGLPSELRLGLESPATYSNGETLLSKDIRIERDFFYYVRFIMLL